MNPPATRPYNIWLVAFAPPEFLPMLSIRPAQPSDVPLLKCLIYEFAEFERLPVAIKEQDLLRDGFGESPKFHLLIAEWSGQPAGYAMYFDYYSSFEGRPSAFLEDIYIRPQYRAKGIGKALIARVAAIAKQQNYAGMRWEVLDWNTPAIDFYHRLGATFLDDRKLVVLQGPAFDRTANGQ
jgi:GNAT superfamily N-acetyltransferase